MDKAGYPLPKSDVVNVSDQSDDIIHPSSSLPSKDEKEESLSLVGVKDNQTILATEKKRKPGRPRKVRAEELDVGSNKDGYPLPKSDVVNVSDQSDDIIHPCPGKKTI